MAADGALGVLTLAGTWLAQAQAGGALIPATLREGLAGAGQPFDLTVARGRLIARLEELVETDRATFCARYEAYAREALEGALVFQYTAMVHAILALVPEEGYPDEPLVDHEELGALLGLMAAACGFPTDADAAFQRLDDLLHLPIEDRLIGQSKSRWEAGSHPQTVKLHLQFPRFQAPGESGPRDDERPAMRRAGIVEGIAYYRDQRRVSELLARGLSPTRHLRNSRVEARRSRDDD